MPGGNGPFHIWFADNPEAVLGKKTLEAMGPEKAKKIMSDYYKGQYLKNLGASSAHKAHDHVVHHARHSRPVARAFHYVRSPSVRKAPAKRKRTRTPAKRVGVKKIAARLRSRSRKHD